MDLLMFGFIVLVLAAVGFFVAVIMGVRDAIDRSRERRYIARTARFAGKSRIAG